MQIILNNIGELEAKNVTTHSVYSQGANREALTLVFNKNNSLDELNAIFSNADNCKVIKIIENEKMERVFNNYTLLVELKTELAEIYETVDSVPYIEKQIYITLAKLNFQEEQLMELTEVVEAIVLEMLSQKEEEIPQEVEADV